jgi:tRNA threonylcarbamoyladenosine biosynthesis protein TsaB
LVRGGAGDLLLEEALVRGHDARLAPMVDAALKAAGVAPRDLTRVAVVTGPGSFTGARVGVAFARGLALALKIEAVGVSALDALAKTAGGSGLLVAVHDARRGELVWRAYRDGVAVSEPERADVAEAAAAIDAVRGTETARLAGSGAALIAGEGRVDLKVQRFALAAVADLGSAADPVRAPAAPFYQRPPDATPIRP